MPEACNLIKKETLAQVFSCEFCEISKNTFYYRTPLVAASAEAYFRPCQTSLIELFWFFCENSRNPLTIFTKDLIIDVWEGLKYTSVCCGPTSLANILKLDSTASLSVARRRFIKKVFLKTSQISQKNTGILVYFIIKLPPAYKLIKKWLLHWCLTVNFSKFLKTPIL